MALLGYATANPTYQPATIIFEVAILEASIEVSGGSYTPIQLEEIVDKEQVIKSALTLIDFTYRYTAKDLLSAVREYFVNLPGGREWIERRI